MVSVPKTRRMYSVVWPGWFLALLLLACACQLPVNAMNSGADQVALPLLGSVVTHDVAQGALFPWTPCRRWRNGYCRSVIAKLLSALRDDGQAFPRMKHSAAMCCTVC
jgi:hypothetical protein